MIERLPDWIKYIGVVMLIFGIPVILNTLSQEHDGYLYRFGDWYFLGLPTVVLLWWGVLLITFKYINYKSKMERFVDKLQGYPLAQIQQILDGAQNETCKNPTDDDLAILRRKYIVETVLQEHVAYRKNFDT